MTRLISLSMPLPSAPKGMATVSSAANVGKACTVTAGALAWTEMQIAHGLEALGATKSECAWVASTPDISRTRKTQPSAAQRSTLFPNWGLLFTR